MEQICQGCKGIFDRNELTWVKDSYGIYYKKVCDNCYESTTKEIRDCMFEEEDYGEQLDPEPDVFGRGFEW